MTAVLVMPRPSIIRQNPATLATLVSYTQLRMWQVCQAQWYFKYVRRLPDPQNSSFAFGKAVHHALGFNFNQKILTNKDLPVQDVQLAFVEEWGKQAQITEFRDDEDPLAIGTEGVQAIEMYMTHPAGAVTIHPAAVEIHVGEDTGSIGGVRTEGWTDLLDVDGRIVDFKTAKVSPSKVSHAEIQQVATYVQITPGAVGTFRIDTLVRNKRPKLVSRRGKLSKRDFEGIERLYPLAQEGMRSGYYMPNRVSISCSRRQCPFWRACEQEFGGIVESK